MSQESPVLGVSVHVAPPLQMRVMHVSEVKSFAVPAQPPVPHVSLYVHGAPSSHPLVVRHCHTPLVFVQ